ncbi:MAG: T9SS type A sorting domain-containing protein [Ignavibacteria bacterium]|nr:T9SS type A sorting domain-containing protein [Ignavibacteria bacterium]
MKAFLKYIVALFLFFLPNITSADTQYSAFEGTHFFIGFMQNEISIDPRFGGLHLMLFIFPSSTTDIQINFPNDSSVTYSNVRPTSHLVVKVPNAFENFESEVARKKAIEIISQQPIIVYGFSTQYLTSDAYTAVPVDKWGKEYVVMSYPNDQYKMLPDAQYSLADSIYYSTPRQSEFLIISAHDSTQITFYPRSITEKGVQVGSSKTIILNRGQTYLVKSFPFPRGQGDLSGTLIKGTKPFGVLSGHVRTAIPQDLVPRWDSKNHLVEMLMPTSSWGREFITVPFLVSPYGDLIKIVSYYAGTTIRAIIGNQTTTYYLNNAYDVLTIPFVKEPVRWISDKPIQVAQFLMHSGLDGDSPNYDPAMTLVPPIEQFVSNITFQTPQNIDWNSGQFVAHYVNIIGDISALDSIYLNDVRIIDLNRNINLFRIFDNKYFWANINIPYGKYRVYSKQGKFAGTVFGVGRADAYALVLGSSLFNPFLKDSLPPLLSYSVECGNIQGTFFEQDSSISSGISYIYVVTDSTYNYSYILGQTSDTTKIVNFSAKVIDPYNKAKIVIEVRDKNGNSTKFSYNYQPPNVSYTKELLFERVKPYDSLSKPIKFQNNSGTINVLGISFVRSDQRFKFYVDRRFPIELKALDSISILITVVPNGKLEDLFDTLIIRTDCNLVFKIPIKTTIVESKLIAIGYDFGDVLIGDTARGKVGIANLGETTVRFDSLSIVSFLNVFHKVEDTKRFTLNPGDTLFFDILFIPRERRVYQSFVVYFDEFRTKPKAEITGRGVAPELKSIFVDFGRVRLGKSKDTLIYLRNTGNFSGVVSFSHFGIYNSNFDTSLFKFSNSIVDSLPIRVIFTPLEVGEQRIVANYSVDWKFHPPISIEAVGFGVIPKLETYNVHFDTIFVFDKLAKTAKIALSTGNENLFIREILPLTGNFSSFEIDYSLLENIILPVDNYLEIPIIFKPEFVGQHSLILLVKSDASIEDTFALNYVKIEGFAKSRDTANAKMKISYLTNGLVCNEIRIDFEITNTGNVPIQLKQSIFNFSNFEFSRGDTNLTEKTIDVGKSLKGSFYGYPINEGYVTVALTIKYGTTEVDSLLFETIAFEVYKSKPNLFVGLEEKSLRIGKRYDLIIRGDFPQPANLNFDFELWIESNDSRQIMFSPRNVVLSILTPNHTIYKLFEVIQPKPNRVKLTARNVTLYGEYGNWNVKVPFDLFLTEHLEGEFKVKLMESICYNSNETNLKFLVEPVCIVPLRNVEIIEEPILINFYPNPVEDILSLEFLSNSKKNFLVYGEIFDNLGNRIMEKIVFDIGFGLNRKEINFSFLENGIYFVKLQFENRLNHIVVFKMK